MTRLAINLVAFQAGWFACVLGAAYGYPWAGPLVVALVVTVHLSLSIQPSRELAIILVAAGLGIVFDSALVRTGWLVYENGIVLAGSAPYWIVAMWMSFATTLNVSLRWLRGRVLAATLFGAAGGPLAYLAGSGMNALEITDYPAALASLAVVWAVAIPVLVTLAARFDGTQAPVPLSSVQQSA